MKHLTLYPLTREQMFYPRDQVPARELSRLVGRLHSAGRTLAKSILREIRDFSNSMRESARRSAEIDRKIRIQKAEIFRKHGFLQGPMWNGPIEDLTYEDFQKEL